jgi:TolA-binding protein
MAEQIYQKASEFPDSPIASEAVLRLAEIAEATGDTAKAQKHRKRAATMIPSGAPADAPR